VILADNGASGAGLRAADAAARLGHDGQVVDPDRAGLHSFVALALRGHAVAQGNRAGVPHGHLGHALSMVLMASASMMAKSTTSVSPSRAMFVPTLPTDNCA
jgi:hypothetical protein